MVASLLTPADILTRPKASTPRHSAPLLRRFAPMVRDFAQSFGGMRHLMTTGAEVIANGIDEASMSFPAVVSTADVDRVGDVLVPEGCDFRAYSENALVFLNHQSEHIPIGTCWDAAGKFYFAVEPDRVLARCFCVQGGEYGQDAADIFHLIVSRAFNDVSVGFNPDPDPRYTQALDTGGKRYQRWEVLEWGPVGIGCNRAAKIIRKYLSDGRITGKRISPQLTKMLTPLAEPKPITVTSGFATPATPAPQSTAKCADGAGYGSKCPTCGGEAVGRCRCKLADTFCEKGHHWHLCPVHKKVNLGSGHGHGGKCTCPGAKRMSKRWGKPGRAKRLQAKHIRHEASRPEGHQWVLYSHDMSKVLGTHPTREAAEAQERAAQAHKNLNSSSGTAGGYAVAEEIATKPEEKPEENPEGADHDRIKGEIARVMEEHKGGDPDYHHAYYKEETGEVHHTVGDAAEEGHAEKVKAALEGIEGVKEVHQGDEHGPEGEGYEKVFPPKMEEEAEEEPGEAKPEEKAARESRKKAMLAFHVGRGKGFMVAAKSLPKARKDALEECVHRKIPIIAHEHSGMEQDQIQAVAYSLCGEKSFDADAYERKDDLDGDADDAALAVIPEDAAGDKQPPSLTLCQQAIENIETALPGMEPETRDFWEDILQQIRDHGTERYPDEDFGGEETAAETAPSAAADREFAEDVADSYRESPEEREGAKRARISVAKSLRALRKGDAPAVLESAASHLHAISKHNVGRTLTKSEKDAAADHARSLDRLHGAVTHGMKAESESEDDIGAISASMPMGDDDEAAHEVEKLFAPVVQRAVDRQLQTVTSASDKHLESLLERIGNVYGLRTE